MEKKLYIIISFLLSAFGYAYAQDDFHLSQFDMASLYINPALTGMYAGQNGDYRIYNDDRSQWASLGEPFTTVYLAYDMPLQKWNKNFGLGGYVVDNQAPQGYFNTFNAMVSAAYNIINKASNKHYLTTGLQMGIFYKNFEPNSYTFDNQYSPTLGGFDQSIPIGENFGKTSLVRFDANYGIYYKYIDTNKKFHPFAGLTVQHLTEPNVSFTSINSNMPMQFIGNVGCDIDAGKQLILSPQLLYMNAAGATELFGELMAYYKIPNSNYEPILGFGYRNQDAFIIQTGIKIQNDVLRISYDVNTSYLDAYTNGRGAWEISLIITGEKGKPLFPKSMF